MVKNYNWLWAGLNIVGIILAAIGMFGVIGILGFEGDMILFMFGTAIVILSMTTIFYKAFKLGLLKESDKKNNDVFKSKSNDKEGK